MRSVRTLVLATLGCALVASSASAQQDEKLSIHGYLTQGYAVSDSALMIGIPKTGTTDYRRAALLLRYSQSDRDNFVIQMAHRRLGESPSMQFESDVKVDWAFYEHQFGTQTRLRVGKMPIQFGIYNEIRYVGTQIPFYRAPYAFYHEGIYTSETVDGLTVSQSLLGETAFPIEANAYAGSFSFLDFQTVPVPGPTGPVLVYQGQRVRAQSALGGSLWISTPIEGLRIGGGGQRYTVPNAFFVARKTSFDGYNAGLDAKFERFYLRSEFRHVDAKKILQYDGWYSQGGVAVTSKISLGAQAERATYHVRTTTSNYRVPLVHDDAVVLSYSVSPNLVVKSEAHATKGFNVEGVTNTRGTPLEGRYFISSLSVAF